MGISTPILELRASTDAAVLMPSATIRMLAVISSSSCSGQCNARTRKQQCTHFNQRLLPRVHATWSMRGVMEGVWAGSDALNTESVHRPDELKMLHALADVQP